MKTISLEPSMNDVPSFKRYIGSLFKKRIKEFKVQSSNSHRGSESYLKNLKCPKSRHLSRTSSKSRLYDSILDKRDHLKSTTKKTLGSRYEGERRVNMRKNRSMKHLDQIKICQQPRKPACFSIKKRLERLKRDTTASSQSSHSERFVSWLKHSQQKSQYDERMDDPDQSLRQSKNSILQVVEQVQAIKPLAYSPLFDD